MSPIRLLRRTLRPARQAWKRRASTRSYGAFAIYVAASERIDGWARGPEAIELARVARSLPDDAIIVEIGSFLGSSAVLLAGGRMVAASGSVHCVDPFDGSGDAHSVPVYREITDRLPGNLRSQFDANVERAGLSDIVVVHEGTAERVAATWSSRIDMLFLDGDQSPAGARAAYDAWSPFLKAGGIIAVHNSSPRDYSPDHDGHRMVTVDCIVGPEYSGVRCVGSTTFGTKVFSASAGGATPPRN